MSDPFIWRGKHLDTLGALMDAAIACASREEAQEFLAAYRKVNKHAAENIGYASGYYSADTAKRLLDWFGTSHPIFGNSIPSAKEAFAAGKNYPTSPR